jgi:hypothetical protein
MMMADPVLYKSGDAAKKTAEEYDTLQRNLQSSYFDWGKLTEEIEKIKNS